MAACECMPACPAALLEPWAAPAGVQANAVLKEERGSLALEDQVGLLLQSLASDSAAVRATALQARPRPRRPPRPCARGPRKLPLPCWAGGRRAAFAGGCCGRRAF